MARTETTRPAEPTISELEKALAAHVHPNGAVPGGIAAELADEYGWSGRLMDVLAVVADNSEKMGYLAGGHRPDEVATWLSIWADSPLSVEQIKLITSSGGWEPDPFVAVAEAGLLETFLRTPDGSARRIRGELAGGWLCDQFATADDAEILTAVREQIPDQD